MANSPSVANFTTWIRNVLGVATAYLPDGSAAIQHAFDHALDTVSTDLGCLTAEVTSFSPYELAVYNLGGHLLVEYAPDQSWVITAAAWSATLVTITTSAINTIVVGDKVMVAGLSPNAYNNAGQPVVVDSVVDNQHFTYVLAKNPGTAIVGPTATVSEQVFTAARRGFKIASFAPGVIGSTSDLSTSAGLLNPDFLRGLTLEDLQLLKTPYGRAYLSLAQKYGPTIWGLS